MINTSARNMIYVDGENQRNDNNLEASASTGFNQQTNFKLLQYKYNGSNSAIYNLHNEGVDSMAFTLPNMEEVGSSLLESECNGLLCQAEVLNAASSTNLLAATGTSSLGDMRWITSTSPDDQLLRPSKILGEVGPQPALNLHIAGHLIFNSSEVRTSSGRSEILTAVSGGQTGDAQMKRSAGGAASTVMHTSYPDTPVDKVNPIDSMGITTRKLTYDGTSVSGACSARASAYQRPAMP